MYIHFDFCSIFIYLFNYLGVVSFTGVFGLVLGGGIGWLSRKFGASVDNILSANVVLANGKHVNASADENFDLFWALRGCASNFAIVTSLVLKAHPIGLCYRGDYVSICTIMYLQTI